MDVAAEVEGRVIPLGTIVAEAPDGRNPAISVSAVIEGPDGVYYTVGETDASSSGPAVEAHVPRSVFLEANRPNPFNPMTTIGFAIPRPAQVTITVHDVCGRQVAVVARGEFQAGEFSKTWDGRDLDGREVASGIYFLRMEAGDFQATRKMALLR